MAEKWMAGPFR